MAWFGLSDCASELLTVNDNFSMAVKASGRKKKIIDDIIIYEQHEIISLLAIEFVCQVGLPRSFLLLKIKLYFNDPV